jgi:N-acetyl-alpha-D-muramate 1-phosphate uridylyltransferase
MTPPLMIFAAGFGTRMGALTKTQPKPMVSVAGKPLIDHALDVARGAGVSRIVINLHYLGAHIAQHLQGQDITFSWEKDAILETGGGLKAALPLLGDGPVLLLNSDAVWAGPNPLLHLLSQWDTTRMDALLLLAPRARATGHAGTGDFLLGPDGRITRAVGADAPIYLGAQILNPAAVATWPETVFSLGRIWDHYIAQDRAFATIYSGNWCDVGSPEGIALAERMLDV